MPKLVHPDDVHPLYYTPFHRPPKGWYFYMPAKDGPPMHKEHMGYILVGPWLLASDCERECNKVKAKVQP
jgi:hypothetical protein